MSFKFPMEINHDPARCQYKPVQLGVGVALQTNRGIVLIECDANHPTRGGYLTPASGLFEGGCPQKAALRELGEELIVARHIGEQYTADGPTLYHVPEAVGYWSYDGVLLEPEWVKQYAKDHELEVDDSLVIPLTPITNFHGKTIFRFGSMLEITAIVAFEPEYGSIEMLIPLQVKIPDNVRCLDGERGPNGQWLGRKVVYRQPERLTTKAEAIFNAFL